MRRAVGHLVVPYVAVSLACEIEHVCVCIEEGHDHSCGLVHVHSTHLRSGVTRVPYLELSLGLLGESYRYQLIPSGRAEEDESNCFRSLVSYGQGVGDSGGPCIDDSNGLVFGGSCIRVTTMVPAEVLEGLRMLALKTSHLDGG